MQTAEEQVKHAAILIIAATSDDLDKALHTFSALLRTMYTGAAQEQQLNEIVAKVSELVPKLVEATHLTKANRAAITMACILLAKDMIGAIAEDILK